MKRVVVDHYGEPEVLRVVEEDDPRPGPGEVRVRVLAAGVSFTDALLRAGTYLGGPKPPFTPGHLDRVLLRHADTFRVGAPHRQRGDTVSGSQPRAARAELLDDADQLVTGGGRAPAAY